MNYHDGIRLGGNIGNKVITVGVAELRTVGALFGPSIDKDKTSVRVGVDVWVNGLKVPVEIASVLTCLRCYGIEWLIFPASC